MSEQLPSAVPLTRTTRRAVFLSYASDDAPAAERICAALRGAGTEGWFDKSALFGFRLCERHTRHSI
jgi:hypothetical protein